MAEFKLHLLKHPNTLESGGPIDTFVIEAEGFEAARQQAIWIIDGAPRHAFEDSRDVFVLCDGDGYEFDRWGPSDTP